MKSNDDFIEKLKTLNVSLSDKGLLMAWFKGVDTYLTTYQPDMWDVAIQGVLKSLFEIQSKLTAPNDLPEHFISYSGNSGNDVYVPDLENIQFVTEIAEPLIYQLISGIEFSSDEKRYIHTLVIKYNGSITSKGKMKPNYVGMDMETMLIQEADLLEHDYAWFCREFKICQTKVPSNIFDQNLLSKIHEKFNDRIWYDIKLIDFLNSFNGQGNKINPKVKADFCFLLGLMEEKRDKEKCPNMENWVKLTFGIKGYKKQKGYNPESTKRVSIKSEFCRVVK